MLLAIDVGNTNTVFALYEDRNLVGQWRLSTNRDRTAEEYAAALIQLMSLRGIRHQDVRAVVISCVVPPAVIPLRWMTRDFFGGRAFVVGEDLPYPIPIRLDEPHEIGADRIVNAVAAIRLYKPPLVIVDFGTATTFDVIDEAGAYCGGAIAPGINLSLEALSRAAAKLPRIAIEPPANVVGKNTVQAMQSGIFWGYVGLIDGLLERIHGEMGVRAEVIATGGLAPLFAKRCARIDRVDRNLTMSGLLELYCDNEAAIGAARGAAA